MPVCHNCEDTTQEASGRWIILGERKGGFEWGFMCIQCIRDWRKRGLARAGYSPQKIQATLDHEYPL